MNATQTNITLNGRLLLSSLSLLWMAVHCQAKKKEAQVEWLYRCMITKSTNMWNAINITFNWAMTYFLSFSLCACICVLSSSKWRCCVWRCFTDTFRDNLLLPTISFIIDRSENFWHLKQCQVTMTGERMMINITVLLNILSYYFSFLLLLLSPVSNSQRNICAFAKIFCVI